VSYCTTQPHPTPATASERRVEDNQGMLPTGSPEHQGDACCDRACREGRDRPTRSSCRTQAQADPDEDVARVLANVHACSP
jgi:hypothetical protein